MLSINSNQSLQQLGGFPGANGQVGGDPMMAMMMQLMQMMMALFSGQGGGAGQAGGGCGQCGGGSPFQNGGLGGGAPFAGPGGGGMSGGVSPNFGGHQGSGGCGNGGGLQNQGNRLNNFLGGSNPNGSVNGGSPFQGNSAATPFAGAGGSPDWANKLPPQLQGLSGAFQSAGQKYNIDPKFLAAISMLETAKGTSNAFRNKNNAMGVSNARGPISFNHPAESIERMAQKLANPNGAYRGANTIAGIGRIYAPPGAGNDPNGTNGYWPSGVSKYYSALGGNPSAAVLQRA